MAQILNVQPFTIIRGDTWRSPKFSFFNEDITEVLGPVFTPDQIDDAIRDGLLTFRDWRDYVITAQVKIGGVDGELWFTLSDYKNIDETGRFLWFEMTATQTATLEDLAPNFAPVTGLYDIQFCKAGEVYTVWQGSITLQPDITADVEVCV